MIETTKLYILISVWMILIFIERHSCMRNWKLQCPFLTNLIIVLDEIQYVATTCWIVEAHAMGTSIVQGRQLCWHDFMKYMFNSILCRDTCEVICLKLNMMLNMTKLYSLISVWMTLMFTLGHSLVGKVGRVQSFCCKVAGRNSNFCDGCFCKGDDCEEVL